MKKAGDRHGKGRRARHETGAHKQPKPGPRADSSDEAAEPTSADGVPAEDLSPKVVPLEIDAEEATPVAEAVSQREEELQERVKRLMADFDNFRKRVRREQDQAEHEAKSRLIAKVLPVLDDYDRARGASGPQEHPADRQVLLRILGRLAEVLEREGLDPIGLQPGDPFDPSIHEAIGTAPSDTVPAQHVLDVFERGYTLNERLLRPARVLVSLGAEGDSHGIQNASNGDGDQNDDGSDLQDPDG